MDEDPVTLPEWQALHREASLVSQIIGAGATALSRASYGNALGEYYTAFFGLSIGIERLAKLILVVDYAIENEGRLPKQKVVRDFGHKIISLVDQVAKVAGKHEIKVEHFSPNHPICLAIIKCLESFADASKGRYANFEAIGNPDFDPRHEPVNKWWAEVVELILEKHYRGTSAEAGVQARASLINNLINEHTFVLHTNENGQIMSDVETASERTGQTKWAQTYGRFYTLCIVRWLSCILSELLLKALHHHGIASMLGHQEFFWGYMVDDKLLLNRKVWPLK